MEWFNYWGLIFMAIIMTPNIIYAIVNKVKNNYNNKRVELLEQIGRYGSFVFMIFNVPFTYFGFFFENGLSAYLIINVTLIMIYCVSWVVFFNKSNIIKALVLSIVPSIVFLFSGIMILSVPLIIFATIFAPTHVFISCKTLK